MSVRIVAFWVLACCLAGATAAQAQQRDDPGQKYVTQAEFNSANARLATKLDRMEQLLQGVVKPAPVSAQEPVSRGEFDALQDRVFDQNVVLGQITSRVAEGDGKQRYILNLKGNLQNPTFRDDLASAVQSVTPRVGKLRIENRMGISEILAINNHRYRIPARETRDFDVPVGTVTTELINKEAPKNWTIGPPNYQQEVVIGLDNGYTVRYEPSDDSAPVARKTCCAEAEAAPAVQYVEPAPVYHAYYSDPASVYSTYYTPYSTYYTPYYSTYYTPYSTYYSPYSTYYTPSSCGCGYTPSVPYTSYYVPYTSYYWAYRPWWR